MKLMETREKTVSEVILREARYDDSYELSYLMGELGYPTKPEEMTERLETLLPNSAYACFVACVNDQVIGMIGLTKGIYFEKNGCYARITALVVSEEFRGESVGRLLIKSIHREARELQCRIVEVETQNTNYSAIKSSQTAGFIITGITTKLYNHSTETAIFMSYDLLR